MAKSCDQRLLGHSLIMTCAFSMVTFALSSPTVMAQTKTPPQISPPSAPVTYPPYGRLITLSEAKIVVAAAEAEARKNNWNMVIVIVEPNGALVMSEKMDLAQYGSNEVARKKAETSALFRRPTAYFQEKVKEGTLNAIFTGAMAIEGGELIISNNQVIGAIGVSGGSGAQDGQVARAAVAAIK